MKKLAIVFCMCLISSVISAEVIRDGIDVDFVIIADPNNPDDVPHVGLAFGGVEYIYRIGKYEITNEFWNIFVSAVGAPTGNLVSAYNEGATWTDT
ncbi:MAG: hypothetical protein JXI43_06370, partial [Tissierellales bacterium]|nr:hypothetical protein [Tissierellales bacterium]